MNARRRLAGVVLTAAVLAPALAACASDTEAEPTASDQAVLEIAPGSAATPAPNSSSEATDNSGGADGEQLSAPGMPELPLFGCSELVDFTQNETDFDTQWVWEFECRTADPFFKSVESMNNAAGFTHTVDAPSGNPDYLSDKHHYIADYNGVAWDVDLSASGAPDELEVTYVVTLAKP